MNPEVANWLSSAEYDLETARQMQRTGRYIYVVFMCHLSLEKALKAAVCQETGEPPPRTHDLLRLTYLAKIELAPEAKAFLSQLADASVATRYPEELNRLTSDYGEQTTEQLLKRTEELVEWLKRDPRLRP